MWSHLSGQTDAFLDCAGTRSQCDTYIHPSKHSAHGDLSSPESRRYPWEADLSRDGLRVGHISYSAFLLGQSPLQGHLKERGQAGVG